MIKNVSLLNRDSWYIVQFSNVDRSTCLIQFDSLELEGSKISCHYGIDLKTKEKQFTFESVDFSYAVDASEGEVLEYFPSSFVPLRMYNDLLTRIEELREEMDKRFENMNDELRYMNKFRD